MLLGSTVPTGARAGRPTGHAQNHCAASHEPSESGMSLLPIHGIKVEVAECYTGPTVQQEPEKSTCELLLSCPKEKLKVRQERNQS